jgi:hypothetical protein
MMGRMASTNSRDRPRAPYTRRCRCCDQRKPVRGGRRYRIALGAIYFLCAECDRRYLEPLRLEQMARYRAAVEKLLAPLLASQIDIQRKAFEIRG